MTENPEFGIIEDQAGEWERVARYLGNACRRLHEDPFDPYALGDNRPSEFHYFVGRPTDRPINHIAGIHGYETDEFLSTITGKVVLDVGGGHSRLQSAAERRGVKTTILNLDLPLTFGHEEDGKVVYEESLGENGIVGVAHQMPVASESVDLLLATYSMPFIAHSADHIEGYINETLRVLKPGGSASISPFMATYMPGDRNRHIGKIRLWGMLRSLSSMTGLQVQFGQGIDGDSGLTSEYVKITKLEADS